MVKENAVRGAENGLAISVGIPGEAEARLNVVPVGLNSFLQSEGVIGRKSETLRGRELRREFHFVAHTVIQGETGARAPGVLPE